MNNCIFCKIISGEIPCEKIYEDENTLAFLDIKPINKGHALVIHKEHHENIFEMPDECLCQIAPTIKKIAAAVKGGTQADGINIGMNNGVAAGQAVSHAHFHIIPRFANDGHKHWGQTSYSSNEAAEVAEKIKKFL